MFSQVRENKYNIGWTSNYNSYSCNVAAGKVSNMYSSRNIDLNGYYYCIGKCYTDKNSLGLCDSYIYKGTQAN